MLDRLNPVATPTAATPEPGAPGMAGPSASAADTHLGLARDSLRALLADEAVPAAVRERLAEDYSALSLLLERLEHGHLHIAVFGRVSVGKSALLNALLGEQRFATSPLHGETTAASSARWAADPELPGVQRLEDGGVFLIDTPGIDEVGGEARERLAREVAGGADLILFVCEGDLTATELNALRELAAEGTRPIVLALNKTDRYTRAERALLLEALETRSRGLVRPEHIVPCAAAPAERTVIRVDAGGREHESRERPAPDIEDLRETLWDILAAEGKTVAALNAGLFAGRFCERLAREVVELRRSLAETVIRRYCLAKGLGVALNPVPLADLAAVFADVAMIVHLGRVYGLPVSHTEAGALLRTLIAQLALLMGSSYLASLASSALKGATFGLSTIVTAGAQGAVAWYGTYVVGLAAQRYFAQGRSWGEGGPKRVVREILASLDRDSLLAEARADILARLQGDPR